MRVSRFRHFAARSDVQYSDDFTQFDCVDFKHSIWARLHMSPLEKEKAGALSLIMEQLLRVVSCLY